MAKEVVTKKENQLVVKKPSEALMLLSEQVAEVLGFNPMIDVFAAGNRVNAVAQWLAHPEVATMLEKLEGSPAGFVTDKSAKGLKYDSKVRAQAIQDCLSQGAKIVGNELNIISGKGMLVKNYFKRMIDQLGWPKAPSSSCIYQMEHWYHKEVIKERGQGTITFTCTVKGRWTVKDDGESKEFSWESEVTVKYGGSHDTIDKAQGQIQRRAWKEFYERYSGVMTEDADLQHDDKAIEPVVTQGTTTLNDALEDAQDAIIVESKPAGAALQVEPESPPQKQEPKKEPAPAQVKKEKVVEKPVVSAQPAHSEPTKLKKTEGDLF